MKFLHACMNNQRLRRHPFSKGLRKEIDFMDYLQWDNKSFWTSKNIYAFLILRNQIR